VKRRCREAGERMGGKKMDDLEGRFREYGVGRMEIRWINNGEWMERE
jgi:hypothetical protein